MFFKKSHILPNNNETTSSSDKKTIYVLGDDDLALYLAAKFKENGQRCILLSTSGPALGSKQTEISLKEEYNLQKSNISITTSSFVSEEPEAIFIAGNSNTFYAHLTLLPQRRYPDTPIVCFNTINKTNILAPLLGQNFYKAYFKGFLTLSGNNLIANGPLPEITLIAKKEKEEKLGIEETLATSGLKISITEKNIENFWKNNAVEILGYLSTYPKQHIMEILNNKNQKDKIHQAASEICNLAKFEKVKLSADDIIHELIDTPRNFYYKKSSYSKTENASRLEKLYNMLSEKARTYKCKIPELNQMIKDNYDYLLKK